MTPQASQSGDVVIEARGIVKRFRWCGCRQ